MIFYSLPPVIEIVTVAGAIGVALTGVVLLLFYCAPTWRKTKEEGKFERIECEHEHQWTKTSIEPGTSTQRIAYYGTLSLSAQNSPTRHLRSISATNPSTHFLSPSHLRSPRRNSSPVAQNQIQIGVSSNRTLTPHVLDLNSYPVQPPYWDPESQQYFHCYSTHASPIRTSTKRCSRSPMRAQTTNMMTASSPAILKRSSPPNPFGPASIDRTMTSSSGETQAQRTPKKLMIDYSNLFLPQPPAPMKNALLDTFINSPQNQSTRKGEFEEDMRMELKRQCKRGLKDSNLHTEDEELEREREDILQIERQQIDDKQETFEVILKKKQRMTIPKICSTPPDDEENRDDSDGQYENVSMNEVEMKEMGSVNTMVIETDADREIGMESKKEIQGMQEQIKDEKHVAEVN